MKQLFVGAVFVGAYALIATEWVHRVIVALTGAGLMLGFHVLDVHDAFQSEQTGVDWNVVFLLFGMMVIVAVLRRTGVFEYLAILSAKRARGRPVRVLLLLVTLTAAASALLDNVTTILLVAPVTVLIAERLGNPVAPFLIAEVMASNIGGTATLVGDPPNILIGSEAGLTYVDFLMNLAPIAILLMVVYGFMLPRMFRGAFAFHPERVEVVMALDEREALERGPLLRRSLTVLAIVTVGFLFHGFVDYEPSVVALLGAGVLLLLSGREDPGPILRDVEWPTLAFFIGLFIMVGALVKVGIVADLAGGVIDLTNGNLLVASLLLLVVSGVLSAVVDNVPYVATMAPIVRELARTLPGDGVVLWWALALGADLGGNATSIGASANVVVLGVSERAGARIRFVDWLKHGALVSAVTLTISALYVWVRYFLLG